MMMMVMLNFSTACLPHEILYRVGHHVLVVDRKRNFVILQKAEREPSKYISFCQNAESTERGYFCRNGIFLQK